MINMYFSAGIGSYLLQKSLCTAAKYVNNIPLQLFASILLFKFIF